MRPSFYPRLINPPFDDPSLYVRFLHENRAILFDAGDLSRLSSRDLLKISDIFVSHTHMDHFVGFDRIVKVALGRNKSLKVFGPKGIIRNVKGKLDGYTWNLVQNYNNDFKIIVSEVTPRRITTVRLPCRSGFRQEAPPVKLSFSGVLSDEANFKIEACILDHKVPCLAFSLTEKVHVNIRKDALLDLGLEKGPWLKLFKKELVRKNRPASQIEAKTVLGPKRFDIDELAEKIAILTPGQKISYVCDAAFTPKNLSRILSLVEKADHLFIEAAFLSEDAKTAAEKYHLTASQAGRIAGLAQVGRFTLFHFSPRYLERSAAIEKEAREAYETVMKR